MVVYVVVHHRKCTDIILKMFDVPDKAYKFAAVQNTRMYDKKPLPPSVSWREVYEDSVDVLTEQSSDSFYLVQAHNVC